MLTEVPSISLKEFAIFEPIYLCATGIRVMPARATFNNMTAQRVILMIRLNNFTRQKYYKLSGFRYFFCIFVFCLTFFY